MSDEPIKASGDLIRWLRMLALPLWAKAILALIMGVVIASALGLLVWSLSFNRIEVLSSAVAILTVALPITLVVVAMVFGDGGAKKLKTLTKLVLESEVPTALHENLAATSAYAPYDRCDVTLTAHGCVADYALSVARFDQQAPSPASLVRALRFKLELNVRKANVVLWLPRRAFASGAGDHPYQSCFFGAAREGYVQNELPIACADPDLVGVVFIKNLSEDFLLNPAERLYFAQDLAFFIRGILNVELQHA